MRIEELTPGQAITLIATIGEEQLQFETTIQESYPKKHFVLADPIFNNEKVISFRAPNLIVDVIVTFGDDKPQLFKNVTVNLMRKSDKSLCYRLSTLAESKTYNRRKYFRCYVGVPTSVQYKANSYAEDAVIKDVSLGGFSFVCSSKIEFDSKQIVHLVLNDYLEELAENFSFHLFGYIVRSYELDETRTVYGCRLNNRVAGLENYIMKKERLRLKKMNGGNL